MFRTALYQDHIASKGKMVDFAGWELPVQYVGVIEEHNHTRSKAGIFDIGHMGEFIVEGKNAGQAINKLVTCNIETLPVKKCRYGLLTNDQGGVIDDMITYRLSESKYMIVCNASRQLVDFNWIKSHLPQDVSISNISDDTSKIDLQGPLSFEVLKKSLGIDATHLKYFEIEVFKFNNKDITISRTGYTGELGVEIYCDNQSVVAIWQKLLSNPDVLPIGLGARDTLRLEVGLALYGHELNEKITPFEAKLDRFVAVETDFIGKKEVLKAKDAPKQVLVALELESKRAAREGSKILNESGQEIGVVSSGSFGPSVGKAIALGYVKPEYEKLGNKLTIDIGRAQLSATIVELPFYKEGTARRKLQS